ncbi:MAG: carbon-nitrogen hydrolase family protein [Gemmatimonadota bacterium]
MRVTVCELPHDSRTRSLAWRALCDHTTSHASELVLLPEFAMAEAVWTSERPDPAKWAAAEAASDRWLERFEELRVQFVVGARPVTVAGRRFNQGYIWSAAAGVAALRRKFFLPNEAGGWEARWFEPGDSAFPAFQAGELSFGLNICTELWALETYAAYAVGGVGAVLSPRATAAGTRAKWMAIGAVAAVRSGAYCLSSNRVDPSGAWGGTGWIIDPDGHLLASTDTERPFATVDLNLTAPVAARSTYPRYVFSDRFGRPSTSSNSTQR